MSCALGGSFIADLLSRQGRQVIKSPRISPMRARAIVPLRQLDQAVRSAMFSKLLGKHTSAVRMFSGAIAIQAMLSASSFIIGLMLVRLTSDAEYGYYVLIMATITLVASLQGSFIGPPMVIRLTTSTHEQRANLIGGLLRDQARLLPLLALLPVIFVVFLEIRGNLGFMLALTLLAGTAATITSLRRNFLRSVLFAYRRPNDVIGADTLYCVLLVLGAYAATFTPLPAATAALTMAFASMLGSYMLSKTLWRVEPWNQDAPLGILREIAPLGAWSAFGSVSHWLFSQGYNYFVAGTLGVTAVAALAATRLLVMPVNLLSTGVASLMLPIVSNWMQHFSPPKVFMRLTLASLGLASLAACYLLLMWLARGWIFDDILRKQLPDRDLLLELWCVIAIVMLCRDQLLHFLVARAKFRLTSTVTLISAVISISTSLIAMGYIGAPGALVGLLLGELFNVAGIVVFSLRDSRAT
jgi:O-antigen/teichoic acid export membrane protein